MPTLDLYGGDIDSQNIASSPINIFILWLIGGYLDMHCKYIFILDEIALLWELYSWYHDAIHICLIVLQDSGKKYC